MVSHSTHFDEPWIIIESVFAGADAVPLEHALELVTDGFASLVRSGDHLALRARLPLQATSWRRLASVLDVVAIEADNAEEELLGSDEY